MSVVGLDVSVHGWTRSSAGEERARGILLVMSEGRGHTA